MLFKHPTEVLDSLYHWNWFEDLASHLQKLTDAQKAKTTLNNGKVQIEAVCFQIADEVRVQFNSSKDYFWL